MSNSPHRIPCSYPTHVCEIQHNSLVTVIWASSRFGHPHSQNSSDMGIPCIPNPEP